MQHVINKQLLELVLNKKQDAFLIQQRMSDFYHRHILPMLEKIFDSLAPEEDVLHFGRMVIDLGKIDLKYLEQNKAPDGLYDLLLAQISGATAILKERQKTNRPYALSVAGQWLFYMEHGHLPWNTTTTNEMWYEQTLQALASDFDTITLLRKLILANPVAIQRMVYQHDETFLLKLIRVLTSENQDGLLSIIDDLCILSSEIFFKEKKTQSEKRLVRHTVWQLLLTLTAVPYTGLTPERLAGQLIGNILAETNNTSQALALMKTKTGTVKNILQQLASKGGSQQAGEVKPGRSVPGATRQSDKPDGTNAFFNPGEAIAIPLPAASISWEKTLTKASETSTAAFGKIELPDEGIFVGDAGLILLHPFLNTFLSRLGLVQGGVFRDKDARQRAVHLLFYLAHGKQNPDEHELVIPKVLCAHPLFEAVERELVLMEPEMREADDLLVAAIAQWTIIKNTSPEGLREGFLQRKGKLSTRQEKLCLQIESNSIDVLLDYLPWGLSIVKLPWQPIMLQVDWR